MQLTVGLIAMQLAGTVIVWLLGGCLGLALGYVTHKALARWLPADESSRQVAGLVPWRALLAAALSLVWGPTLPRALGLGTTTILAMATVTLMLVSLPLGAQLHQWMAAQMARPRQSLLAALRTTAVLSALLTVAAGWTLYWGIAGFMGAQLEVGEYGAVWTAWGIFFALCLVLDLGFGLAALAPRFRDQAS